MANDLGPSHSKMILSTQFLIVHSLLLLSLFTFVYTCPPDTSRSVEISVTEDYGEPPDNVDTTDFHKFWQYFPGISSSEYFIEIGLNLPDAITNTFTIAGGNITVEWIDREAIARGLGNTYAPVEFEFSMIAYGRLFGNIYGCVNVSLKVLDLDDNTPTYVGSPVVEFNDNNEDVGIGKPILYAVDDDEGDNGTAIYTFFDPSGKFEIEYEYYPGTQRVRTQRLRNIQPLDREDRATYFVILSASENNSNPDSDSINVTINILERCDEPSQFPMSRYTSSVVEHAHFSNFLVNVTATDADDPVSCPLVHSIQHVCRMATLTDNCNSIIPISSSPFTLDSETGQLRLKSALDREQYARYDITISATDPQSSSTVMVEVTVEDINDNKPEIVPTIAPNIPELQAPNLNNSIGIITVSDRDEGRNGQVIVHLLDNSTGVAVMSQTFRLIQYKIVLAEPLNFESQRRYDLIIEARDNGTQPLYERESVTIFITDQNDHAPEFINLPTDISIPEDSGFNDAVTVIQARDEDSGVNARILFSLPESNETYPYQNYFQIDSSGELLVDKQELDYEEVSSYTILVVANNSRSERPLFSSTELVIALENVNDNRPEIEIAEDPFEIEENASEGDVVGYVVASDADNLAPLSYTITSQNSPFSISGQGEITLVELLDFELQQTYVLEINVFDGLFTSSANFTVNVRPINDERPVFKNIGTYFGSVQENLEANYFVLAVEATDRDIPAQRLEFTIEQGEHRDRFRIDSISGRIYTTTSLDREITPNYTLWIQVSDGELTSDLKEVFIMVKDINDHVPEFIGLPYVFEIFEKNRPNDEVGQVFVISLDSGNNATVKFNISAGNENNWFKINETTGVIRTNNTVLDREAFSVHEFSVEVSDQGTPNALKDSTIVTVKVLDVNDNPPSFEKPVYNFTVREDFPIGQVFGTLSAYDPDSTGNNETHYRIHANYESLLDQFNIDLSTGQISLVSSLDFETTNRTVFEVTATDAGSGDFQTSTRVVIDITNARDLNLTLPVGFSPHYAIYENIPANYTIVSFEVRDTMLQSVGRLIYRLTTLDGIRSEYFGIRKEGYTAVIYTRTDTIDRESDDLDEDKTYRLKLNVSDPDTTEDSYGYIVSFLTIRILDVNDNDPEFLSSQRDFFIQENGGAGDSVAILEVRDPDEGSNATLQFSIVVDNAENVPFNVTKVEQNGQQYVELRARTPLDREVQSSYNFFIRAADGGTPNVQHVEKQVVVFVTDVNDNDPVICEQQPEDCVLEYSVREDLGLQEIVGKIDASDPDYGTNSALRFEHVPGYHGSTTFHLDESTGEIYLIKPLDREEIDRYELRIRALDGGNRPATATVIIHVRDVNEYSPDFTNSSFTTSIPENQLTGIPFTALHARDQDTEIVEYVLADNSLSRIFCVNRQTGAISLCNPEPRPCIFDEVIDYERQNEYKVVVIAYDTGVPRRYSNATLTVQITNVNEHNPTFDTGRLTILASENLDTNDIVLRIQAYDLDADEDLQYSIVYQNPENYFVWSNEEKALVLSRNLDYSLYHLMEVDLKAVDTAGNHQIIAITILVLNENNHKPIFDTEERTIFISESTEIMAEIFTVHAMDADNQTNDAVTYFISNGNTANAFYIDPVSGALRVFTALDYETESSYTLTILANDTGEPMLVSDPVQITVLILNENDEEPEFSESEYTFHLTENTAPGVVDCVTADDRDEGSYGEEVYSIIDEGEHEGFFSINHEDGCISSLKEVDRELIGEFELMVQAQDSQSPSKFATVRVTIIIVDENDNEPTFSKKKFISFLSPDFDITQTVGMVTASDADIGENSQFIYEITQPNEDLPIALSQDGEVTLNSSIPTDFQASYSTGVRVSSTVNGDTSYDDAVVIIVVETDSDHHPRFTQLVYESRVSENVNVGYTVFDASDVVLDGDGTSGFQYEFVENYAPFALDTNSGLLTLQEKLNYEDINSYTLKVRAIDDYSNLRRTATATIKVIVEDGNDHAPVFTDAPTHIRLSRVPYRNIELFTVRADDADDGSQGEVGYSIVEESDSNLFEIDPSLGVVTNKVDLMTDGMYSFVIRAFDKGSPLKSSNITVNVEIHNPENPPQFAEDSLDIQVQEDHEVHTSVSQLVTNPVAESYHIVFSNASREMFSISENNLELNSELDYETATQYMLIIEARTKSNGYHQSSFLVVNIIVTDVNDNSPQFTPIPPQVFSESQPTDEVLFTVSATDADFGTNADIVYAISGGNVGNAFEIGPMSGEVKLVQPLDRESTESYDLRIRAQDQGTEEQQFSEVTVNIQVTDVNDNIPTFKQANYTISVYEYPHTHVGDTLIHLFAEDPDLSPSPTYHLEFLEATFRGVEQSHSLDTFHINFDTGVIIVRRNLNREEIDRYVLKIEARNSIPEYTASTLLTVHVLDMNDHRPQFEDTLIERSVYELMPIDTLVADGIRATDNDIGPNGIVQYSLGDSWPEGKFKIDPWTGVIRLAQKFSYTPELKVFDGEVIATDQGIPANTATMTVRVRIIDVNDHPPLFESTNFGLDISINHPLDQTIFQFNYTDKLDDLFNTNTEVVIPSYYTDANALFELDVVHASGPAVLKLKRPLVEADIMKLDFRVEAIQVAIVPYCPQFIKAAYAHVSVTIHPENLNAPQFININTVLRVSENVEIGTNLELEDLVATDEDGNKVTYNILSPINLPFTIEDPERPAITITHRLNADLEESARYTVTVEARDNGFPVQVSSATLNVIVEDVNDLPPKFNSDRYYEWVTENSPPGTHVLTVSAVDLDRTLAENITYEIVGSDSCSSNCPPFTISPSGEIKTTGTIDYEKNTSYFFQVAAMDRLFKAYVPVTIDVAGENEFAPKFDSDSYEFTVEQGQVRGYRIGRVVAKDDDTGIEGTLVYNFTENFEEPYNIFVLNSSSGEIFLNNNPNIIVKNLRKRNVVISGNYVVLTTQVLATDSGSNPASATAKVTINADKTYFDRIGATQPASPDVQVNVIIAVVVVSVSLAILVFLLIVVIALFVKRNRSKSKNLENFEMMTTEPVCGHYSGTANTALSAGNPISGTKNNTEDMNGIAFHIGHSPSSMKPNNENSRSTSDLASTIGTEALHSQTIESHPYTKAQLKAIYAANAGLLDDTVSHDSVHMFGSEGGREADGEDINNIIFQKINDLEDDEESLAIMDDDTSTVYSKGGRGTALSGSTGNLDVMEREDHEMKWIPPSGMSMVATIDEMAAYASQEEPPPRRPYEMYSHSQGPYLYGTSATQDSFLSMQPPPKLYHPHPHPHHHKRPVIPDYSPHMYYPDEHNDRLAREHERERQRYIARPSHRYGSASVLPANYEYHREPKQHYRSQELAAPYAKYSPFIHGERRQMVHPVYMTPTEGTEDGTVTPQTALTGEPYGYLSSSSTSLTSTNVSGNLSQPSRRLHSQMFN